MYIDKDKSEKDTLKELTDVNLKILRLQDELYKLKKTREFLNCLIEEKGKSWECNNDSGGDIIILEDLASPYEVRSIVGGGK